MACQGVGHLRLAKFLTAARAEAMAITAARAVGAILAAAEVGPVDRLPGLVAAAAAALALFLFQGLLPHQIKMLVVPLLAATPILTTLLQLEMVDRQL